MNDDDSAPNTVDRRRANLRPPWPKGFAPNPRGRGSKIWTLLEWIDQLADATRDELAEIVRNKATPASKLAAAVAWLRCIESENFAAAHNELHSLLSRFFGKPKQEVDVRSLSMSVSYQGQAEGDSGNVLPVLISSADDEDHTALIAILERMDLKSKQRQGLLPEQPASESAES